MFPEYKACKKNLCDALELVAQGLEGRVALYALLETQDPGLPFEVKVIHRAGNMDAAAALMHQRLFDAAFIDYGFREVLSEDKIEGVSYEPIDDMLAKQGCIGVADLGYFDVDQARARMAAGIDEEPPEEDLDAMRFVFYLNAVRTKVLQGEPAEELGYEDTTAVKGLVFKYVVPGRDTAQAIVAFQRVQPMWVQKKSNLLLYSQDSEVRMHADRSLKMGTSFDFVQFDGKLMFRSMKALEMLFAYRKLVAQQAKDYADTLDALVADYDKLDQRIMESRAVANRLLKVREAASPVADMATEELEACIQRIPYYNSKLKLNEEGKVMLVSNTDVSDFLRLLSDDYLVSPLSQARYEVRSKKRLDAS